MGTAKRKSKATHSEKVWNKRIFELVAERVSLTNEAEKHIFKEIGISDTNVPAIKKGTASFTVDQIISAANIFGVSTDWICGLTNNRSVVSIPMPHALEKLIERKIKEYLKNRP